TTAERKADRRLEVLERERQSMQRSDALALCNAAIGVVRQRKTPVIVEPRDDGVELRVQAIDLSEVRGHHLVRRDLTRTDRSRDVTRAGEAQIHTDVRHWRRAGEMRRRGR